MSQYWFKPKTHGYGAAPANWKGWAAVAAYVAVVLALTLPLLAWPTDANQPKDLADRDMGTFGGSLDLRFRTVVGSEDRWTMGLALGKVG